MRIGGARWDRVTHGHDKVKNTHNFVTGFEQKLSLVVKDALSLERFLCPQDVLSASECVSRRVCADNWREDRSIDR